VSSLSSDGVGGAVQREATIAYEEVARTPTQEELRIPQPDVVEVWDLGTLSHAMAEPRVSTILLEADIELSGMQLPAVQTGVEGEPRRLTIIGKCGSGTFPPYGDTVEADSAYSTNSQSTPCVIDARGLSRHFEVAGPGELLLQNLVLVNGYERYGGAIAIWAGSVVLRNVNLEYNTATARGGAISNWHGTLRCLEATLESNVSTHDGHAVFQWGGHISADGSFINGRSWRSLKASADEAYWN